MEGKEKKIGLMYVIFFDQLLMYVLETISSERTMGFMTLVPYCFVLFVEEPLLMIEHPNSEHF